jgi:hypothetical protein
MLNLRFFIESLRHGLAQFAPPDGFEALFDKRPIPFFAG